MDSRKAYIRGNKDDIKKAVECLDEFTHNFCMDTIKTVEQNDLVFRCAECTFQAKEGGCLLKKFKNKFLPEYKNFGCMGDL